MCDAQNEFKEKFIFTQFWPEKGVFWSPFWVWGSNSKNNPKNGFCDPKKKHINTWVTFNFWQYLKNKHHFNIFMKFHFFRWRPFWILAPQLQSREFWWGTLPNDRQHHKGHRKCEIDEYAGGCRYTYRGPCPNIISDATLHVVMFKKYFLYCFVLTTLNSSQMFCTNLYLVWMALQMLIGDSNPVVGAIFVSRNYQFL